MARLVLASVLAVAEATRSAVTWGDCGAKHATVTDVQPSTLLGVFPHHAHDTLTLTGTTDEAVTAAHFTVTVSAPLGATLTDCSGDGTTDIVCNFPMGVGKITVKALSFPLAKGTVNIPIEVQTSLANVDVHIAATEQNGEDVICLDVRITQGRTMTPTSNTNLCLDVPGGDASNGNQLWLWECHGGESQRWLFHNDQIRYVQDQSKCIDAGDMSNGTQLYLWDCNGEPQPSQTFALVPSGGHIWHSDKLHVEMPDANGDFVGKKQSELTCLDYYGDWESNGQPLHVWQCTGDWNQYWALGDMPSLSVV